MLSTGRQRNLKLYEMNFSQIQHLPQLAELFIKIKSIDDKQESLLKALWAVFGGIPLGYTALQDHV